MVYSCEEYSWLHNTYIRIFHQPLVLNLYSVLLLTVFAVSYVNLSEGR